MDEGDNFQMGIFREEWSSEWGWVYGSGWSRGQPCGGGSQG